MRSSYRLSVLIAALGLSVASAGSKQTSQNQGQNPGPRGGGADQAQAPMDANAAMGLWKSNFGAVKIETDPEAPGTVRGVWLYERNGQEVIGYFAGALSGNMLQFSWEEPASGGAPMAGAGYLTFDPQGQSFQGKWWTSNRDRGGNWSGWRGEGRGYPARSTGPAPVSNDPPAPAPLEPGSDFI